MSLQTSAPDQYDQRNEATFRSQLDTLLKTVFRKDRDVEIGQGRVILKDEVSGARYRLKLASGVLSVEALP